MTKKLIASLVLTVALTSPAFASDPTILFFIDRNGRVFIDCFGVVSKDMAWVKKRLEELKRWEPNAPLDFDVEDGAPPELVSKYHKLVFSEGFRVGKSSGFCP